MHAEGARNTWEIVLACGHRSPCSALAWSPLSHAASPAHLGTSLSTSKASLDAENDQFLIMRYFEMVWNQQTPRGMDCRAITSGTIAQIR
jgi:hypothetical protein